MKLENIMLEEQSQKKDFSPMDRLQLESNLRNALEKGEFKLLYQPQMDIASGSVIGAEALLRWHTEGNVVSPEQFVSLAEGTGLIIPIGEWVLETACRQAAAWQQTGVGPMFRVAVNLSAHQFHAPEFTDSVARILQETGCEGEWLELEVTESALMEHPDAAAETFAKLASMGITISVDDFGTGYSNLAYLKRFTIHRLKIDRSFVSGIAIDPNDTSIVRAVIALAHSLKLQVIGEGVENKAQLGYLLNLGCDFAQGYYISKPLKAGEITDFLLKGLNPTADESLQDGMTVNEAEAHRGCRVLRIGERAVCLSAGENCGFVNPHGNVCEHPLLDRFNDVEADY